MYENTEYFDVLDENGVYLDKVASRDECHRDGFWHKAVVVFIISTDGEKILLQQRSATKKLWPNAWDITAGGHVLAGELGHQAVIRETKEEIGVNLDENMLEFIGASRSENVQGNIVNRHFNEYYIVHADVDPDEITLQEDEVQNIKWFGKNGLIKKIKNNYEGLTDKVGCWEYLLKYFEITSR